MQSAVTVKKHTKKHDARAKLFWQSQPIAFLPSLLTLSSLLLKLPIEEREGHVIYRVTLIFFCEMLIP